MKLFNWLAAGILAIAACSGDSTGPADKIKWYSTKWEYSFVQGDHSEGIAKVNGVLTFERHADSVQIYGHVLVDFWFADGADTTKDTYQVWPAGVVLRGLVSAGDTFRFTQANFPSAWPTMGEYVLAGDSLTFTWREVDAVKSFLLKVVYK